MQRLVPLLTTGIAVALVTVAIFVSRTLWPSAAAELTTIGRGVVATGTLGTLIALAARTAAFWRARANSTLADLTHQPDYLADTTKAAAEQLFPSPPPGYASAWDRFTWS
jgi:hypothetical protein